MKSCPKCGAILEIVHRSRASFRCRKCGYKAQLHPSVSVENKKLHSFVSGLNKVVVAGREESRLRTFPVVRVTCPKCGATQSEAWMVAVGSEGTTSSFTFFRCTSCGYTRREAE
jgi:DNA-directed RNA polymerase subunit M/transcription elongation factor TFIIS